MHCVPAKSGLVVMQMPNAVVRPCLQCLSSDSLVFSPSCQGHQIVKPANIEGRGQLFEIEAETARWLAPFTVRTSPIPHHMPASSGSGESPGSLSVAVSNPWGLFLCFFLPPVATHSSRFYSPRSPRLLVWLGHLAARSRQPSLNDAGLMQTQR